MAGPKKILLPTDFSEASLQAFPHAVELAGRTGRGITVFYVHLPFADDPYNEAMTADIVSHVQGFVEARFAELKKRVSGETELELVEVRNISAAAGILDYLEEEEAEMVVLGTHGHSRIARFLLGSVTEKVVRYSPVPVLTVGPGREGYRNSPVYRKILIPYDFSKCAYAAVQKGLDLARIYSGAKVWIICVVEQEVFPGQIESWKKHASAEVPDLLEEVKKSLDAELDIAGVRDVEVDVKVGHGDGKAHTTICSFAETQEIDLIVMGTYGLSGVEKILLGSTTEKVIRMASSPVMVLHGCESE